MFSVFKRWRCFQQVDKVEIICHIITVCPKFEWSQARVGPGEDMLMVFNYQNTDALLLLCENVFAAFGDE